MQSENPIKKAAELARRFAALTRTIAALPLLPELPASDVTLSEAERRAGDEWIDARLVVEPVVNLVLPSHRFALRG